MQPASLTTDSVPFMHHTSSIATAIGRLVRSIALGAALTGLASFAAPEAAVSSVRQVLDTGAGRVGETLVVEGFVTGVCKHSGCKAFLHDTDPAAEGTIRVERTGDMSPFSQDLAGKTLRVRGTIRELRIDAAYLDSWQARIESTAASHSEEDQDCADAGCENALATKAALKKVAELRTRLSNTPAGYISSIWIDGTAWESVETAR